MIELVIGVLSALTAIIPPILHAVQVSRDRRATVEKNLAQRSLDELDRGVERVRAEQKGQPPVQR